MKILKKIILTISIVLTGIILTGYILLSPIAEYVIEKNSVEWAGRKIDMKNLWINLLTGTITINKLNIYETDKNKIFFSANNFFLDLKLYKAILGNYDISEVTISKPELKIIQQGSQFNFDDLVKRFTSGKQDTITKTENPAKWWLRKLSISYSSITYQSTQPKSEIVIDSLNISSTGMSYSNPIYPFDIGLLLRSGGSLKSKLEINTQKNSYTAQALAKNLNLNFLLPYLKDYMYVKSFGGFVNSEILITGDLNKTENLALNGSFSANQFSLIDTTNDKLSSFDELHIQIDSINTAIGLYHLREVSLKKPYLKFAMYEKGYNFDRILVTTDTDSTTASNAPVEEYTNIFVMMADYIKTLTESYMLTNYKIDTLSISQGALFFQDYTLEEKFNFVLDSAHITSGQVDSKAEKIHIDVRSNLNKSGRLTGYLDLYTANMNDMDINYTIEDMLISDINPYSKFYVATPFINGTVYYASNTSIHNNYLKSTNQFKVEEIKVGSKSGNPLYDMPIKLAVSLLTDLKGNINLDIPIEGDLNDPKFKVWKIVWQVLKNILVKAVTAPYRLLANSFGGNEDEYREIPFDYLQTKLYERQMNSFNNIARVLKEKPEMRIELMQVSSLEDEAEQFAIREMKKEYLGFQSQDSIDEQKLQRINEVSIKDSLFILHVNQKYKSNSNLLSVQEKCINIYGKDKLFEKVTDIKQRRNNFVLEFLTKEKQVSPAQLIVHSPDSVAKETKNTVPRFVINYSIVEQK